MSEPLDDALDALAHVQRRRLLTALLEHESQAVSPVADSEGAADRDCVALRHIHLPKLASAGFVDWDRERGEVSRGPAFEDIRPLLELLIEHEGALPGRWL